MSEIIIVTGSRGKLGRALLDSLSGGGRILYGLQRQSEAGDPAGVNIIPCDLDDFAATGAAVRDLLKDINADRITLVHAVGPFKYEGYTDTAPHDIDPHILRLNDEAFENIANTILSCAARMKNPVRVDLCAFGSVSEPYNVPLWFSFNEAKRRVRHFIQSTVGKFKNDPHVTVSGLYLRTSTINTANENSLRPHAPDDVRNYWLAPEKVAADFGDRLDILEDGEFSIVDVISPRPGFDPGSYYRNIAELDRNWRGMMKGPG